MILAAILLSFPALGSSMGVSQADPLPRKGSLGIGIAQVPADVRTKDGLKAGEGVLVQSTFSGATGAKAGLQAGDVLLAVNGQAVSAANVVSTVSALPVGRTISLKVVRGGAPLQLSAVLAERPRDPGNDRYEVIYSDVVSNGHRMRTIITKPRSPGKHPSLMFIQGFAGISYDYFLDAPVGDGLRLDAPILAAFANRGFVTMRVEKPGVGDSEGGPFADVDFITELDIYRQALKQLKGLNDVDADNVFIFGHSMGGAFGPMIACEIPVKGMAMYGIEARTFHEYLLDTLRYQALLGGASYADIDDGVRKSSRVFEYAFQDKLTPEEIKKAHPDLSATVDEDFPGGLFNAKTSAYWSQLENINLASYWTKCNTHVLVVHGASDFVSYEVDHRLVADIVNKTHPGWGTFATAPSSDHLFSNWKTEAESLSHWPKGDYNPAFERMMEEWVDGVMKGGSK